MEAREGAEWREGLVPHDRVGGLWTWPSPRRDVWSATAAGFAVIAAFTLAAHAAVEYFLGDDAADVLDDGPGGPGLPPREPEDGRCDMRLRRVA